MEGRGGSSGREGLCNMKKLLISLFAGCCLCLAQVETGSVTGVVTDASGAVVPDAEVKVTNLDTGISRTLRTSSEGNYSSPPLRPGRYRVEAAKQGFQRAVEENLRLEVNQRARVDFKLVVGEITQAVLVQSEGALVETQSAALGNVRHETEIQNLPLNGRNFVQLVHLVPGVNSAGGGTVYTYTGSNRLGVQGASVNGARPTNNNFLYDGIQSMDTDQNVLAFLPNL